MKPFWSLCVGFLKKEGGEEKWRGRETLRLPRRVNEFLPALNVSPSDKRRLQINNRPKVVEFVSR